MLETDAATFAPQVGRVSGDTFPASPLLYLVHCLAHLDDFLHRARREAADKQMEVSDLHVSVASLRRAVDLWWKADSDNNSHRESEMSSEVKANVLLEGLCKIFPKQIAWKAANGVWYCAGYRVRGRELPVDAPIQWTFLSALVS